MTENENIREVLLDLAIQEKTHLAEFLALLLRQDEELVAMIGGADIFLQKK